MTPEPNTDERVAVSVSLLQRVADDTAANRTSLAVQAQHLQGLQASSERTATASMTMAALAEARAHAEAEDRATLREQEARAEERTARTYDRLAVWVAANWRYFGIVLLLIFYPQVLDQIRALGMIPTLPAPAAAAVAPASVVAPAAMPSPDDAPGAVRAGRDDGP